MRNDSEHALFGLAKMLSRVDLWIAHVGAAISLFILVRYGGVGKEILGPSQSVTTPVPLTFGVVFSASGGWVARRGR